MEPAWVIDIKTGIGCAGEGTLECQFNHDATFAMARLAAVTAAFALNEYCKAKDLGIAIQFYDPATGDPIVVKVGDPDEPVDGGGKSGG